MVPHVARNESQEAPHRGSHDGSSLHLWGSGSGRCAETSTGRLPAKPSTRGWVSCRAFFENWKGTGLLAVLHPIFKESAAGDPESCRYDVSRWERQPSPSRPRFVLVRQDEAIKRQVREELALREPAVKIARPRVRERPCRGRFTGSHLCIDINSHSLL